MLSALSSQTGTPRYQVSRMGTLGIPGGWFQESLGCPHLSRDRPAGAGLPRQPLESSADAYVDLDAMVFHGRRELMVL